MLQLLTIMALGSLSLGAHTEPKIFGRGNINLEKRGDFDESHVVRADYPFLSTIFFGPWLGCTGSLVEKRFILTLASCVYDHRPHWYEVRAGSNKVFVGGKIYKVESIHMHPKSEYWGQTVDKLAKNNIAILQLTKNVTEGEAKPVSGLFNKGEELKDGENATLVARFGASADFFSSFDGPVISWDLCSKKYDLSADQICADVEKPMWGTSSEDVVCFISTGAPLVDSENRLLGMFSGYPRVWDCYGDYGTYISIAYHRNWIDEVLEKNRNHYEDHTENHCRDRAEEHSEDDYEGGYEEHAKDHAAFSHGSFFLTTVGLLFYFFERSRMF